jgi:hypothetical protein
VDEGKRFIGVDVAKAQLEVFIGSSGESFSLTNDEVAIDHVARTR